MSKPVARTVAAGLAHLRVVVFFLMFFALSFVVGFRFISLATLHIVHFNYTLLKGLTAVKLLQGSAATVNKVSAAHSVASQAHLAIAAQYCICLPSAHRGFQPSTHNSCFLSFLFLARLQQFLGHLRQISARRQSCTSVCWCSYIVRHVSLPLCIFFL